jgi:PAS domain S-box-containing protein
MTSRLPHTLLLVEDSPEDRETYRAWLCEDPERTYSFLEAEDAERALELCRTHVVDCILLDYHLPTLDGLEFLRRLGDELGQECPPVVMLTGRGNEQLVVRALQSGAADYLVKSDITPPSLFRAVNGALRREELRRGLQTRTLEQQRLQTENQRLAAVVTRSSSFIGFSRADDGTILYINEAGRRMVGLGETEDLSSLRGIDLLTPEDVEFRKKHIMPAIQREGGWQGEFRLRNVRTGAIIPVQFDIFFLPGDRTMPGVLAVVAQDITELKHQEQEAQRRADFEQYLAGIVGHDLRNPISVIMLAAGRELRRKDAEERLRETLKRILVAAERANRMIDTTLDFTQARLGGGLRVERRRVDVHELTRQVVDELRLNHPDRVLEVVSQGEGSGELDGDRLAQVITNLVTNALKYSTEGTPVRVRTSGREQTLALEVHNEGNPIPAELLPRLFTPLKRGEPEVSRYGRSMGLGLFIVDHIDRAHGGLIDVESDETRGTTFTVHLPRKPAPLLGGGGQATTKEDT